MPHCIYLYIYIFISLSLSLYIYIYIYVYIYIYIIQIQIYRYIYHIYTYIFIYVYIYIYIYIYIHIHMHIHIHIHIHMYLKCTSIHPWKYVNKVGNIDKDVLCFSSSYHQIRLVIFVICQYDIFKIEIVTNLQEVDFLDVTFNLISNTYRPYKKPNDNLTYINTSSNRPSNIKQTVMSTIECGFTPKHVPDMTRTYNQIHHTDKYSEHSLIIWPV